MAGWRNKNKMKLHTRQSICQLFFFSFPCNVCSLSALVMINVKFLLLFLLFFFFPLGWLAVLCLLFEFSFFNVCVLFALAVCSLISLNEILGDSYGDDDDYSFNCLTLARKVRVTWSWSNAYKCVAPLERRKKIHSFCDKSAYIWRWLMVHVRVRRDCHCGLK